MAGATTGAFCRICVALGSMSSTYLWWDSAAAAERVARRLIARRPEHPSGWSTLIEPLLRQGRRAEAELAAEPTQSGLTLVVPGLILQNGSIVKAFAAAANVVVLTGFVNAITD